MEDRRRAGEANSNGNVTGEVEGVELADTGETEGGRSGVHDHALARRSEGGGELRDVSSLSIPMEDHTRGEGEDDVHEEDEVDQELQKRTFFRRICPAVLVQLVITTSVVLTINYGLETVIHANLVEILVCEILAVALICAACACCALRLATNWPWCIAYLIIPSMSFGIIFGVLCVVYAEGDSFLVALGFSCSLYLAANIAFFWLATGVHFVNPNGWLISFGDMSRPEHWAPAALSIYLDFALMFVLSLMVLGVRHKEV